MLLKPENDLEILEINKNELTKRLENRAHMLIKQAIKRI
jgi:hypothetical protein